MLRFGFPRRFRLTGADQFQRVFKQGERKSDACFTYVVAPNGAVHGVSGSRLGLAIATKVAGNAPRRNRLKRWVRECFRRYQPRLPNVDVVVIAKPAVLRHNRAFVQQSLDQNFHRMTQLNEPSASSVVSN